MGKVKITKKILVCLNTPQKEVKDLLESKNLNFKMMLDPKQELGIQKRTIFGFTSFEILQHFLNILKRPPVLWENPSLVKHISLNQPVILLDSNINNSGLIFFKNLDYKKLLLMTKRKFNYCSDIKFEKCSTKHLGNGSILSVLFNTFLSSLPDYIYEPTIVAFVTAIETQDYKIFDDYIVDNRLLTDENKKVYTELSEYLTTIKKEIEYLVKGDKIKLRKIKDKTIKVSLARLRFLLKYFGTKKIEEFLDVEGNVNVEGNNGRCAL